MRHPSILLLLFLIGCSSTEPKPLPVTQNEVETLQDAGFARLGGRTWRSGNIWRQYIHTCFALYSADIICSGSESRRYAVVIFKWEGGEPLKVYGSGGAKLSTLYEAVGTVHHEIERHESDERWYDPWMSDKTAVFPALTESEWAVLIEHGYEPVGEQEHLKGWAEKTEHRGSARCRINIYKDDSAFEAYIAFYPDTTWRVTGWYSLAHHTLLGIINSAAQRSAGLLSGAIIPTIQGGRGVTKVFTHDSLRQQPLYFIR